MGYMQAVLAPRLSREHVTAKGEALICAAAGLATRHEAGLIPHLQLAQGWQAELD